MLASQFGDAELEKLYRQTRYYAPSMATLPLSRFMDEIAKVRSNRYCYVPNMPLEGGGSVAMLLPRREGGRQLVIGVGGMCDRLDANLCDILNQLRSAVAAWDRAASRRPASRALSRVRLREQLNRWTADRPALDCDPALETGHHIPADYGVGIARPKE
jgi:hypothetical protein